MIRTTGHREAADHAAAHSIQQAHAFMRGQDVLTDSIAPVFLPVQPGTVATDRSPLTIEWCRS
ncbi:hypothetical protein [Jiangella gansuensis]|uniref:hypothetical protein n=1 Tax=Jiangella gansuensis TaxID=281473 RepID=UPI00047BA0D6|nr:hypothetical protein [Jiangella gansuensis]